MKKSEQINEIAKALAAAQGAMKPAVFDCENTFFKKGTKPMRYASLKSCMESIRDPLRDNGLFVSQDVTSSGSSISVSTTILHASGQWLEYGPCVFNSKDATTQGFGSAITYGKRYCLCASLGIVADDDDDANDATFGSQKTLENAKPDSTLQPKKKYDDYKGTRISMKQLTTLIELIDGSEHLNEKINDWLLGIGVPNLAMLPVGEYEPLLIRLSERKKAEAV